MRLRPRHRAKPCANIGMNIRHLAIRRVGGSRIHFIHRACCPDFVVLNDELDDLCSTCSGCTSYSEDSCASMTMACPCVADFGSDAACSEAPSYYEPRERKESRITFNDSVETIEVPLWDDCGFVSQTPQRCDYQRH